MIKPLVLIVSNKPKEYEALEQFLADDYETIVYESSEEILATYRLFFMKVRAVLITGNISDSELTNSLSLLKQLRDISVIPEYIFISEQDDIDIAVDAVKAGAFDYLISPLSKKQLLHNIEKSVANKNHLSKLKHTASSGILEKFDLDIHLTMGGDFAKKKRLHGEIVTVSDMLTHVPPTDPVRRKALEKLAEELKEDKLEDGVASKKRTLLIVEDDPLFSEDLQDILSPIFKIILAQNGKDALDVCNSDRYIDIVLLDIYLPDMTGIEILKYYRKKRPHTGVIMMTGFQETDIAIQSLQEGANDYINKPFFKDTILSRISDVLQHYYFMQVVPKLEQGTTEDYISFKSKLDILTDLCEIKKEKNEAIVMGDIYTFFPECKQSHIPAEVAVPSPIIEDGLLSFVEEMYLQYKGC